MFVDVLLFVWCGLYCYCVVVGGGYYMMVVM